MLSKPAFDVAAFVQRPEFINAALILLAFLVAVSLVVVWSRDQVKVRDGQIMTATRVKRQEYSVRDEAETLAKRDEARKSTPRIYRLNETYLKRLEDALLGLPKAVAGKTSLDEEFSTKLRDQFRPTESDLRELQRMIINGDASADWKRWVGRLVWGQLPANPLIRGQEFQDFIMTSDKVLLMPGGERKPLSDGDAIELQTEPDPSVNLRLQELIEDARVPPQFRELVFNCLTWDIQPTILFDEQATAQAASEAASLVLPVEVRHKPGEVLYTRGEKLDAEQYAEVLRENQEYLAQRSTWDTWQLRVGVVGLITIITIFLGSFAAIAYPRIVRNPARIAAICALLAGMVCVTVVVTANAPIFLYPAAIGPALFASIVLLVAYDQRLALLLSGIHCMVVTLALEQSIGFVILLIAGCATAIAQLREVRHRNSLIRAATVTAAVLGAGTMMLGLLELPAVDGMRQQILVMALSAVLTSYGVSFLVLGILPSIERLFDIVTGMTLAELRDPKRPLLRQLQQRAPGTYNHSLQVANIAEAAADAIGADGLLVYVGALYHDVGKINKPEYFVENQAGGYNRHEKLSPAMSLLVILGHVKNGVELAREYGVPRQIQHFIESHHGTTLVEYFYHAARLRAEGDDDHMPVSEVEYRYPGPKPRTKEAAILMLADAVESSTRAMAEPNPSRIESLVRKLSSKRLEDGQFDNCDLTFRELRLIEDAIINRLLAIYHSRISYPTSKPSDETEAPRVAQAKPASA